MPKNGCTALGGADTPDASELLPWLSVDDEDDDGDDDNDDGDSAPDAPLSKAG